MIDTNLKLTLKIVLVVVLCLIAKNHVLAQMTSDNYKINWDSINSGGTDLSSSANYSLKDTLGQFVSGMSESANYSLGAGYRTGADEPGFINFSLRTEKADTGIEYSGFSNSDKQVSLVPIGFEIGDYIAVVEDIGGSQKVAVGKITGATSGEVYVDKWSGDHEIMSETPSGGDDLVYKLEGGNAELGTLSFTTIETSVTAIEVTTNSRYGYTAYIYEDDDFKNAGGTIIDDVSDGTITVGDEEYGISTTGDSAVGSGDFAITGSFTAIAEHNDYAGENRTIINYQASIAPITASGEYSHKATYIVVGNF